MVVTLPQVIPVPLSEVQLENEYSPIVVILDGIITVVKLVQLEKVLLPMVVNPLPKVTLVRLEQYEKT